MDMPLSRPCHCGTPGTPNLSFSRNLSAGPIGRGAYNSNNAILYYAIGTSSLLRWNTNGDVELPQLAVAGAGNLQNCEFNPANGFLYCYDVTAGNTVRKIDPATGNIVSTIPLVGASNDIQYSPTGNYIFTSGNGDAHFYRIDTADAVTSVITSSAPFALAYSTAAGAILGALTSGIGKVIPGTMVFTSNANGITYRSISSGDASGQMILGRAAAGADQIISCDPGSLVFASIPAGASIVQGVYSSGGYSAQFQAHFFTEDVSGITSYINDSTVTVTPFGGLSGQGISGAVSSINDARVLTVGIKAYVTSKFAKTISVFVAG